MEGGMWLQFRKPSVLTLCYCQYLVIRLSCTLLQQYWVCCSCEKQNKKDWRNYIMRTFTICTFGPICYSDKSEEVQKGKSSAWVKKHFYRILIQNDTSSQTQAVSTHHTLGPGVGFYGNGDEHMGKVCADFLQTLTDSLTLLEGYIIGNEQHAIQHFQTRMAHLVQHHHARAFVMQHWADIRLGGSSCHLQKAGQHNKMNQHITHLPDGSSTPSCAVLPTTGS